MNNTVIKAILDTTDILVIEVIMDTREIKDITFVKIENVTVVKDQVLWIVFSFNKHRAKKVYVFYFKIFA